MTEPAPLQLLAEDPDDLAVISAALQDAVAKVGDISYEARSRRLTIAFNRFRWEAGLRQRVRSALQIGGVMAVQARFQDCHAMARHQFAAPESSAFAHDEGGT